MAISSNGVAGLKPGVVDSTATRPASPFEGQMIFQKDTDQLLIWNGSAWVIPNSPAQNPQGLELITTQTFSSQANCDCTAVFNANYENYFTVIRLTTSAQGQYTNIQLLNGTTPKTTNYSRAGFLFTTGGVTSTDSSGTSQDGFRLTGQSTAGIYATAEFFRPFTSNETGYKSSSSYQQGNALIYTGTQTESYSATGFRILSSGSSVTYTGTVSVYGYRN
jgi:hypothetical protein